MEEPQDQIRLFIGAEIPSSFTSQINHLKNQLGELVSLKWTHPENLHVTIFFIGSIRPEMLENVISLFRLKYQSCDPITLRHGKWAWAPNSTEARMLWVRFPKSDAFSQLAINSQAWFSQIQELPQQRFRPTPHITVARIRPEDKNQVELPESGIEEVMKINSLRLWRSDKVNSGAKYTPLATFQLGKR